MPLDRRSFLHLAAGAALTPHLRAGRPDGPTLLRVPRYDQVAILGGIAKSQADNAQAILATFDDDALLMPFRQMGNLDAPGRNLGGWYEYLPDYNWHNGDAGLAPGHCFGQWTSAMARFAAAQGDATARNRVLRLHQRFAEAISPDFFDKTRYPAYTLDKLNIGFLDAHTLLDSPAALAIADKTRQCALPSLPGSPYERDIAWRKGRDFSFTWDESYTLPENLYLLYGAGAGDNYRTMARAYLMETFFAPLARKENILGTLHGYSHVNALGSAMQAFFVDGSQTHLQATLNAYRMIEAQTYASGGWAPDELFEKPGSGKLLASLTDSHNNFETPCGTYAFLKLSRSLLQLTREAHYGDAMERILLNSMFGALPLQPDGRTFYYADLNQNATRVYSAHRWPCCAGTFTQVAADYGINTYLLDPEPNPGLWVNLYLPSAIRWTAGEARCTLTQSSGYPATEHVQLTLQTTQTTRFPLHLRLPAWCTSPTLHVNGRRVPIAPAAQPSPSSRRSSSKAARWAIVDRLWRNNDRLDLHLPATLRLEPFPADDGPAQPHLAALCWGPWVLLPLAGSPTATADQLLRAERTDATEWRVAQPTGDLRLRPFSFVGDDTYATYIGLA